MMKEKISYIVMVLCFCISTAHSQIDSLQVLPEVILSDVKLRDFSQGVTVARVTDSVLSNSKTALTEVLRYQTLVFLRENGPGGVSSASFRGTSAQQTAVVWNGININSQLNGQTDFNTISSRNYDNIDVRSGGGSIPYGSGAIGGSIHLNNEISFAPRFENRLVLSYGSFNTPSGNFKSRFGTKKFYGDVAVDYTRSDNDFEYLDTDQLNENGQFENTNLNANFGFTLSRNQLIKVYHNTFLGDRNFSGTLTAPSDDSYQDRNTRTLVEWQASDTQYDSKLRVAHVFEQFRYFPTEDNRSISTIGKAIRYTANYDFTYRFGNDKRLKTTLDYTTVDGEGSNIQQATRNAFSASTLWHHQVTKKWNYGIQARQEVTNTFDSPLLFGMSSEYAFAKAYKISINASRNYRIPSYNDVYWQGAGARGNPNLIPETSIQAEIGHRFTYKDLNLRLNTYYILTQDLIVWRPDFSGIWSPENLSETRNYGTELTAEYSYKLGAHLLTATGNYGYTIAEDRETGNQLLYVPKQKITGSVGYTFDRLSAFYQILYNDKVYTTTDNSDSVAGYGVSNLGVNYSLVKKQEQQITLSLQARNILNKNYQTIAFRPNPGRNFLIQTTYTF
ncbi:TonB-dependent receptor [uncultured Dokdonia sp.]|uniref:TonB-dependent receptor n=1 Tax=uncultured Dokdonia sp. TaxID=575653 RepID=UPI002633802F|nr:TonB-dependent receptor [uncultured Dokdonia sp.]